MRVLVYFKPKTKFDNFEGARLRKTIKGALEINSIEYTSNEVDRYDIAHFISPNDEAKINACVESGIPVVMSALYCESDLEASYLEYETKKEVRSVTLSQKAIRVLNKVNLVLAPTLEAKQFLVDSGVTTPIEIVTPGVNLSRFNLLRDEEMDVFYRYYREERERKLVVSIGSYDNVDGVSAFIKTARLNPKLLFYYFAQRNIKLNHKYKSLIRKSPKNCHFVDIPEDDIYRSALINSTLFMYNGYDTVGIVSVLEAMAARSEIIVRNQPLFSNILINEKTCHIGQYSETLTAIACDYLDDKIYPTKEEAFKYAASQGLDVVGEQLKAVYDKLLKRRD